MSTGAYSNNPTAGNPQVTQSQVVLNADFDRFYLRWAQLNATRQAVNQDPIPPHLSHGTGPDIYNMMPREMCFTIRSGYDNKLQRHKLGINNPRDMRVFSSANHMAVLTDATEVLKNTSFSNTQKKNFMAKSRQLLRSQISFVGVPLTKVLFDENLRVVGNDKVPVQISGSTTIWNTGPWDIHPGDLVMWDIPWDEGVSREVRPIPGLPTDKKSFWTVPLRETVIGNGGGDDLTVSTLVDTLNTKEVRTDEDMHLRIRKEALGTDNTFKEAFDDLTTDGLTDDQKKARLKELLFIWNIEWQSYTSRVIGRALKGASPGMAFDIMLQRAM